MASFRLKLSAAIISGLIAGSLITLAAHTWFNAARPGDASPPERKVLFWYDPMKPDAKFDKPGKSPFMDMDLVPKYADDDAGDDASGIRIDPALVQNLGLTTRQVTSGRLDFTETLPANVSFNDYQYVVIQARSEGFVDKAWPLTVGDRVKQGAPLMEATIPAWVEAQSEYLLLADTGGTPGQLQGVLERLRLAGMPESDIQRLRRTRTVQTRFTLRAPIDGVITAFDVRTGMNISKDKVVARIQGMDPVWVTAAVPESIAGMLNDASQFTLAVPAYPDHAFHITKWQVLPSLDPATRTLQVRLEVTNPGGWLKPGMNATLGLRASGPQTLIIPSQAVIDTGAEQRVITVDSDGRFVPKIIRVQHESRGQTSVSSGLEAGESVVVNGLFLIDSEANISGALERMRPASTPASAHAPSSATPPAAGHAHAGHEGHSDD